MAFVLVVGFAITFVVTISSVLSSMCMVIAIDAIMD